MNIFITVGTTPFDDLIKACDEKLDSYGYTIKAQISNSAKYIPTSFDSFSYDKNIIEHYEWADIVIAHAGAGTFYQLMEMGKKTILIPNQELKDNHQNDICNYAQNNNYAYVLNEIKDIKTIIKKIQVHEFNTYKKDENKISQYIYDLIIKNTNTI